MANTPPFLTDDLKQISECLLYRDPRVSRRARLHTFCRECKESCTINQESCPLCRPFFRIPKDGCGSIPGNYFMAKLVDLHQMHLELKGNLKGDQILDVPLVEEFEVKVLDVGDHTSVAWLENKLYITFNHTSKVHVFADRAPFEELEGTIEIQGIKNPCSMAASTATGSIFVGDKENECIWKIQMPGKEFRRLEANGKPWDLSITPNGELLAGVFCLEACYLNVFDLTNFSRKVIPLPSVIVLVISVVQTLSGNFIISYLDKNEIPMYDILTTDGMNIIKTMGYRSLDVHPPNRAVYHFAVLDDGQILVSNEEDERLSIVDSDLTGFRVISNNGQTFEFYTNIVYIREKQQLLVQGFKRNASNVISAFIAVYHLSPCYSAMKTAIKNNI